MYVALRSMRVQNADGVMRIARPGEPVPEAARWKNVRRYLKKKWIRLADEPSTTNDSPDVPAKNEVPVPAQEPVTESESEVEESETEFWSEAELRRMPKADLQTEANRLGVDPDQTRAQLMEAILAAQ